MTREDAIYLLRNTAWLAPSLAPVDEAIDMAIEALSVDLVRCGECKHESYCCRMIRPEGHLSDDYCSYGEKRTNEID